MLTHVLYGSSGPVVDALRAKYDVPDYDVLRVEILSPEGSGELGRTAAGAGTESDPEVADALQPDMSDPG